MVETMNTIHCRTRVQALRDGAEGVSLLETVFALMLLLIVSLGLLPLGAIATTRTENEGHLVARTTEYAQDKVEQLLALAYGDSTSDTRNVVTANSGGTGLSEGGSADPNAPAAGYVDYLDADGGLLSSAGGEPSNWYYKRVWKVSIVSNKLKKVEVVATVKGAVGGIGQVPRVSLIALKTDPF
jgi:hypothetical protein